MKEPAPSEDGRGLWCGLVAGCYLLCLPLVGWPAGFLPPVA